MGILLSEQNLMQNEAFLYEQRLNSPTSRFLDKTPTFVTYYHINHNETTVDGGYKDVEEFIGKDSPIKFQKIKNFPIYGIEQIVLSLQDSEQGLDSSFEDDAFILPNTLKPLQNDFFVIPYLKDSFVFRVTEIQYDNIRPDNFYKIQYRLEYLCDDKVEGLENQVHESFECILGNIGTELNCFIDSETYDISSKVSALLYDMVNTYKSIFYNERYNCFLGYLPTGKKLYDPLQTVFFNKHNLLNNKNDLKTIVLTEGFADRFRKLKYEKSIYRMFERRDINVVKEVRYNTFPGMYKKDSVFFRWSDQSIEVVDLPTAPNIKGEYSLLPSEIANIFVCNGPTDSKYIELMKRFIRGEELTVKDIPLDLNEHLLHLQNNEEMFFYTPILMYIIQQVLSNVGK